VTTITISAGGKVGSFRGNPGVYAATLLTHTIEGPFQAKAPKPGESETFMLHEWGFVIDGAPDDASFVWVTSGESTGPKSKTFGIISALLGGQALPPGTDLVVEEHLIGRRALVDVRTNERGYLDVFGVTPLPVSMQPPAAVPAAPVPVAASPGRDPKSPF
jgi:hypothetical protein